MVLELVCEGDAVTVAVGLLVGAAVCDGVRLTDGEVEILSDSVVVGLLEAVGVADPEWLDEAVVEGVEL